MSDDLRPQAMTAAHTCHGAIFCGCPPLEAQRVCPACQADDLAGAIGRYAEAIVSMDLDELLDALIRAARASDYGSHDQEIAMLREEINARAGRTSST